jgi:hypothetical protein
MPSVTIADIDERLQRLPPDKLIVVYDFVSHLLQRDLANLLPDRERRYPVPDYEPGGGR